MDYWSLDNPYDDFEQFSEHNDEEMIPDLPTFTPPPTQNAVLSDPVQPLNIPHFSAVTQSAGMLHFDCTILKTPVDEIRQFCIDNPNSYIVIPTEEKGLLRLSRINKYGYRVALIATLKDLLK